MRPTTGCDVSSVPHGCRRCTRHGTAKRLVRRREGICSAIRLMSVFVDELPSKGCVVQQHLSCVGWCGEAGKLLASWLVERGSEDVAIAACSEIKESASRFQ
ncbi:hypothetical protein PLESTF_001699800 [Pleodorina starrii]|nr:hypothetical protein PLESTF_001699800 [Pleodorina starrii]